MEKSRILKPLLILQVAQMNSNVQSSASSAENLYQLIEVGARIIKKVTIESWQFLAGSALAILAVLVGVGIV